MTEADDRVRAALGGHEPWCHAQGCPGFGFCMEVGFAFRQYQEAHPAPEMSNPFDMRDDEIAWLETHNDCGTHECDCIVKKVQDLVREERALVLEQVADAAYTSSANKPPRVVRVMRQSAQMVREGTA
jgi:hypothetical protein